MLCDAEMRIMDVVARWPGSVHDQRIFNNSRVMSRFEANEFPGSIILGDGGYENRPYLVTPLSNPQSLGERLYNESQIRSRCVIERTFGVLKKRFPILAIGMRCSLDLVMAVIHATTILHNIAIHERIELPEPEVAVDTMEDTCISSLELAPVGDDRIRDNLIKNYFSKL